MTTTPDAVQTIANTMADIERRLRQSIKDARQLRNDFKAIAQDDENGVTMILASARHVKLLAILTTASSEVLDLHNTLIDDAGAYGVPDLPPIDEPEDDGEIGVLGGGDR